MKHILKVAVIVGAFLSPLNAKITTPLDVCRKLVVNFFVTQKTPQKKEAWISIVPQPFMDLPQKPTSPKRKFAPQSVRRNTQKPEKTDEVRPPEIPKTYLELLQNAQKEAYAGWNPVVLEGLAIARTLTTLETKLKNEREKLHNAGTWRAKSISQRIQKLQEQIKKAEQDLAESIIREEPLENAYEKVSQALKAEQTRLYLERQENAQKALENTRNIRTTKTDATSK